MIYSREEALNFLGKACSDLNILRDRNYEIVINDFDDMFHKIIFATINNLALEKDINEVDGIIVDTYLRKFPSQHKTFEMHNGIEFIEAIKNSSSKASLDYSYKTIKKFSLLRRFKGVGMDISELWNENSLDISEIEKQRAKLDTMTIESIKEFFKIKLIEIDLEFQSKKDSYSFKAGDGVEDLILRCQRAEHWGVGFQSKLYNAVFRGMLGSKFFIRSGSTGSGKSRSSLADMCEISCVARYNLELGEWVVNPNPKDSLFISTELTEDELHLAMLASISGIPEDTIKDGKYTQEQVDRLSKAIGVLKESKIHCEYCSNFSINELENIIEKHIIRNNIGYIFFDYIQITQALSQELIKLFGYVLREDQMLWQLSSSLKNLANKYNVFIMSSTQLNRNYKSEQYIDITSLRGGLATADKADYVVITMPVSKVDLEKLKPLLEVGFKEIPTHAHHVCKNRGGKWTGIIIWTKTDLDTLNLKDCFVTTQDFELISNITPVVLK